MPQRPARVESPLVPPQPFIDLSSIDFAHPRYGLDEIRKLLPHRGAMAQLDAIVSVDVPTALAIGYKDVRADEFWSAGHFPGNPLLPGVVIVEAAAQLSVCLYKIAVPEVASSLIVFGGVDEARFRGAVRPGERLVLVAKGTALSRRMARCATQAIVGDRVVYEGTVLGIPT